MLSQKLVKLEYEKLVAHFDSRVDQKVMHDLVNHNDSVPLVCLETSQRSFEAISELDKEINQTHKTMAQQEKIKKQQEIEQKKEVEEELKKHLKYKRRKMTKHEKLQLDFQKRLDQQLRKERIEDIEKTIAKPLDLPSAREIFEQR